MEDGKLELDEFSATSISISGLMVCSTKMVQINLFIHSKTILMIICNLDKKIKLHICILHLLSTHISQGSQSSVVWDLKYIESLIFIKDEVKDGATLKLK